MSKRQRLRLLTSLIIAGCIFAGSVAISSAAEIVNATDSNYIAIAAESTYPLTPGQRKTITDPANNKKYTYILTSVSLTNPDNTTTTKQYWVREGYSITATSSKYFEDAQSAFKLDAYANTNTPSSEHLVFSSQNGITDTTDTTAINNDTLHLITYKQYAAATNTTISTPSNYNYYILRNGKWIDAGVKEGLESFKSVKFNSSTGYYQLNGENIPFENVYFIDDRVGVFTNKEDGSVYKGPVYGANNEILVTAYDKESNTWSSVWGMQITDPNATIGSMTVSQFESVLSDIHNEDVILSNADVEKTIIDSSANAIQLRNKKGNVIPGFTVESVATVGQDTQIKFTDATDAKNNFSINAGSRVIADATNGNLTGLSINGEQYTIAVGGATTDYRLVGAKNTSGQYTDNYSVQDGKLILNVSDGTSVDTVTIEGIATTSDVTNATTVVQEGKNISVTKDQTKNLYTIATKDDVSFKTVTVGNVKVDSTTGKITGLTAGTADTDAVNVSQLKEVSTQASKYTTVDTDSNNLEVSSTTKDNETKYTVSMKNNLNLTANGSVTIGSTLLDNSGLTAGTLKVNSATGKITGLTAGTADTDAVNVSQLNKASTASKTDVKDGSNISVTESTATDGHSIYTVTLNDDITVNSVTANLFTDGQVSISNGQIIGEKYAITKDGGAIFANGAVSISGDGTLRAGNQNFTVYQDGTLTAKYRGDNRINATKDGVSLSKGTAQAVVTDDGVSLAKGSSQVVVNALGTTFANGVNGLTNINGGIISAIGSSHKIVINGQTGTIKGLSNKTFDANHYVSGQGATEDQLKQVYDELKTNSSKQPTVSAGDNISVTTTTKDGQTDYQVSLKNDIALDQGKITTGNITIDGTSDTITAGDITIDGANGTITGLTNTTWSGTTTDASRAATEGQLQDLQDKIDGDITNINSRIDTVAGESIIGGTGNDDGTITINKSNQTTATITGLHDYALQEGSYQADTDGNVSLTVKDRYSNGIYSATIEDVASKKSLDSLTSAVGADSKETVKESYSNTYYIQDKDTLIDADVQLDKEIKQNRDQIIDNSQSIQNLNRSLSSLNNRVNKVGAGASALAALHPMDFDPDDKLNFSAGVGNYAGSTAAAIGAFYRPNERVMFSVGGTVGNGENMVNAGVTFALGKGGKISNTRVAVTHEILELRQQVAQMNAMVTRLAAATGYSLDEIQQFPDVPDNHWAYEYVGKLAAAGIIEGYPDGSFGGERAMTRYEFATMLFKALDKGAIIDDRILDEFEPEIGRLHVERIKGEQNSRKKIERVRLHDKDDDRDVYGSKILLD